MVINNIKTLIFIIYFIAFDAIYAMDFHYEREFTLSAEDKIGILINDDGTKKFVIEEKRNDAKITREINWNIKSESVLIEFTGTDAAVKSVPGLSFSDIVIHVLKIKDPDLLGPDPRELLYFMLPINNRIGFLFRVTPDGFGIILRRDFKTFKKKSKKVHVKSLIIPLHFSDRWIIDNKNAEKRTRTINHLSFKTTMPDLTTRDKKIETIDRIVINRPVAMALVGGTHEGNWSMFEQVILGTAIFANAEEIFDMDD